MSPNRILVVDDTREIGRMIKAALDTLGPGLVTTVLPTAEEALQEIDRQVFDLMVIDVRLPGISGLELTRKLRSHQHTAKVIQISGITDPRLREMATQLGAEMFFSKPLNMQEFLAAVEKLIGMTKTSPRLGSKPVERRQLRHSLDEAVSAMRQRLTASAIIVFEHSGKVISGAGELPAATATPDLYQILSASLSAAAKAGSLFNQASPENVAVIRGEEHDLVAAPIGTGHVIMALVRRSPSGVRLAIAMDELLANQKDLEELLTSLAQKPLAKKTGALPAQLKAEPAKLPGKPLPSEEELDTELAGLLNKHDQQALKPADVDAFWSNLADDNDASAGGNQDVISFEQAQKMGLAPREGN